MLAALERRLKRFATRHPRLHPARLFAARTGWVRCTRQGLQWSLCVDRYVDQQLYLHGAFEPQTTAWVRDFVRPGMHVLDAGANFGYFTTLFAQLVGPAGHVWAFEPTGYYGERIQGHLELNGLQDRATVLPYGLSNRTDQLDITIAGSSATLHPVHDAPDQTSESITLRRLDDVADHLGIRRLDLVKIDIDGHEVAMLDGAAETLRRTRPVICIEFSQANLDAAGTDARELHDRLAALGYELRSEATRQPYPSRRAFLLECGNYTHSANAWAFPRAAAAPPAAAHRRAA